MQHMGRVMTSRADEADDLAQWPNTLRDLALLVGRDATLRLAHVCGGLDRVYIPRVPTSSHAWKSVLGDEAWSRVVDAYGGQRLDLPRGCFLNVRKREIITLAEQGVPHRQIALQVHVTERYVRGVLQGMQIRRGEDPRQCRLFDGEGNR